MKKRTKYILLCMINIPFTFFMLHLSANSGQTKLNELTLLNIEALSQKEVVVSQIICYGTGSVDCPISEDKVSGYETAK